MHLSDAIRVTMVAGMLAACGGPLKYEVASSPNAPGADASITADVRKDEHQTELSLKIENLPPADRVEAGSTHYVAWYRRDADQAWKRIAGLDYEVDSREARLESSVPETAFDLWVTTETELDAVSPSPNVVFRQHVGS